ncbi:DUF475 domain-containing protein [Kineococcus sp. NUM-3379]
MLKTYGWSFAVLIAGLVGAILYGGPTALLLTAILVVLEVSLSFDNAVVNATVLRRMNDFWQKIFLTVGVLIAVFGMRLVFPVLLVAVTANLGPIEAIQLAMEQRPESDPTSYAAILNDAHPTIAAFGGMFLLMLFLDFITSEHEEYWIGPVERLLSHAGKLEGLSTIIAGTVLVVAVETFAQSHRDTVLFAGLLGILTYLLVNGLGEVFNIDVEDEDGDDDKTGAGADKHLAAQAQQTERAGAASAPARSGPSEAARVGGKAAFFLFLYLEVLDASFSFDGVIGAFAITYDPIIIAIGLGVGAMFVRSMTVHLVRDGTLSRYPYLENGAMWAIGALAVILIISIEIHISEIITGLIGVAFIGAALASSIVRNRRDPEHAVVHAGHRAGREGQCRWSTRTAGRTSPPRSCTPSWGVRAPPAAPGAWPTTWPPGPRHPGRRRVPRPRRRRPRSPGLRRSCSPGHRTRRRRGSRPPRPRPRAPRPRRRRSAPRG